MHAVSCELDVRVNQSINDGQRAVIDQLQSIGAAALVSERVTSLRRGAVPPSAISAGGSQQGSGHGRSACPACLGGEARPAMISTSPSSRPKAGCIKSVRHRAAC